MSTFKRSKVVMLPTTDKSRIILNHGNLRYAKVRAMESSSDVEPQHLYFLSDDEIKEGDWCIYQNKFGNTPIVCQAYKHRDDNRMLFDGGACNRSIGEGITPAKGDCKKIIATTDKSLMVDATYFDYRTQTVEKCKRTLAEPSQGFIKKYCEKGGIDEVMVEYEDNGSEEWYGDDMEGEPVWREQWQPRVAPDNTITIKPIKDSWSREEVESITYKATSEFLNRARKQYGYLVPFGFRTTAFTFKGSELKEYLKENL